MRAILEVGLALFAVLGLISTGWYCLGHLLLPAGGETALVILPGRGDGAGLENGLAGLLWLKNGGLFAGRILIADCGLTAEGQRLARLLCRRWPEVGLCPAEAVEEYIQRT